jgi:hypothetical protein
MQRHRCGEYEDGKFFGRSRAVMSKGRALKDPSYLLGRALGHAVASAGPMRHLLDATAAPRVATRLHRLFQGWEGRYTATARDFVVVGSGVGSRVRNAPRRAIKGMW